MVKYEKRGGDRKDSTKKAAEGRAVVLESGLGLETFLYRLGLVLDSLVFGLRLVSDMVIGLAKCSSWSRPSPAIQVLVI